MLRALIRRVVPAPVRRLRRRVMRLVRPRYQWKVSDVADATGPAYNVRCYLERRAIRELLREFAPDRLSVGVDVGCGYGRLTMVLAEFFDAVIGLEREEKLLETARQLLPDITFTRVPALTRLPLEDRSADFLMTFTVLQHLTDEDAQAVIGEIKRAVRPGGIVLLMEKTDPGNRYGDVSDRASFLSQGRAVATFEAWMAPCSLVREVVGRVEPTYHSFDRVGSYMLFRVPETGES